MNKQSKTSSKSNDDLSLSKISSHKINSLAVTNPKSSKLSQVKFPKVTSLPIIKSNILNGASSKVDSTWSSRDPQQSKFRISSIPPMQNVFSKTVEHSSEPLGPGQSTSSHSIVTTSITSSLTSASPSPSLSSSSAATSKPMASLLGVRGYSELKKSEQALQAEVQKKELERESAVRYAAELEKKLQTELSLKDSQISSLESKLKSEVQNWQEKYSELERTLNEKLENTIRHHSTQYEKLLAEYQSLQTKFCEQQKKLEEVGVDPVSLQSFDRSVDQHREEREKQLKEIEEVCVALERDLAKQEKEMQASLPAIEELHTRLQEALTTETDVKTLDDELRSFEAALHQIDGILQQVRDLLPESSSTPAVRHQPPSTLPPALPGVCQPQGQ